VAAGLDRLLERQELRLARERLGLRRAELALYRVDGGVARARIGTSRPVRDPGHLRRLFDERLDKLDLGFGVDVMTLMAPEVEALTAAQLEMAGPAAQAGQDSAQLAPLVDRLEVRLGRGSVVQLEQRASHIPERAQAPVPVFERAPITPEAAALMGAAANVSRPLRLFPRPQPVDAMAEVPDGPPVMFRWRRLLHRIVHAEGPERIAPEWWRDTAPPGQDRSHLTRDYYRIEDAEGRRFWVFREGLYDAVEPAVRPVTAPRWFLHGVFA
jgi:protein ImuB